MCSPAYPSSVAHRGEARSQDTPAPVPDPKRRQPLEAWVLARLTIGLFRLVPQATTVMWAVLAFRLVAHQLHRLPSPSAPTTDAK